MPNPANILTSYRVLAAPLAAGLALIGWRDGFFILLIASFVSDLVDGPIARSLGRQSASGAKLDTIADALTLLVGIFGLYRFHGDALQQDLPWVYVFLASYGAAAIACLAKFGSLPAYHLYVSKIASLCSGAFFVWLYLAGYSRGLFLALASLGVLANLESLLVTRRLNDFRTDIGSLFLVRAANRNIDG